MAWDAHFWKPIKLSDGRRIATLQDARAVIATVPSPHQEDPHWRDAQEMLSRAAVSTSAVDGALSAMIRALKADGLV
jgi:hypothetical protein